MTDTRLRLLDAALICFLLAGTWFVFGAVRGYGFVNIDDPDYVLQNPVVGRGLGADGIGWAFSTLQGGNWHPLTWISHMLVVQVSGLNPGGHHLANLLLHAANIVLLYVVLVRLSGVRWPSAAAAALFAVHPLHVESVAWISERKDVLSTFFWLLALLAYERYVRRPNKVRLGFVFAALTLGLLAKPMLVTVPLVLLLLDGWPLGRLAAVPRSAFAAVLVEKIPLFALSVAASVLALAAQSHAHAVSSLEKIGPWLRVGNALRSTVLYLRSTLWPDGLAALYPYVSEQTGPLTAVACAALLVAISVAVFLARRRHPELWFGWLWYLVTLVPVIGVVQIGRQMRADRYTYVPLIGIFVAIAWFVSRLLARHGAWRIPAVACAVAVLVGLAAAARVQVGYWRDNTTLFRRSLEVSPDNPIALKGVGVALTAQGRTEEGQRLIARAHELDPRLRAESFLRAGGVLANLGRFGEAVGYLREALRLEPGYLEAQEALADLLRAHPEAANARPGMPAGHPRVGR